MTSKGDFNRQTRQRQQESSIPSVPEARMEKEKSGQELRSRAGMNNSAVGRKRQLLEAKKQAAKKVAQDAAKKVAKKLLKKILTSPQALIALGTALVFIIKIALVVIMAVMLIAIVWAFVDDPTMFFKEFYMLLKGILSFITNIAWKIVT